MLALGALAVSGCGGDVAGPNATPEATPVALSISSGDGQQGNVGSPLANRFTVQVTDARGEGVGNVEVIWTVTSGTGVLSVSLGEDPGTPVLSTLTNPRTRTSRTWGAASVLLTPTAAGTSTVTAEVAGLQGSPVTFTALAVAPDWPPVDGSALVFERKRYQRSTIVSHGSYYERYVLHEDGTFALQSVSGKFGFGDLGGTYAREGGVFSFDFTDYSESPDATGTLSGDCLMVEYAGELWWDFDFENAEYCRPA